MLLTEVVVGGSIDAEQQAPSPACADTPPRRGRRLLRHPLQQSPPLRQSPPPDVADGGAPPFTNYERTFRFMAERRWNRTAHGTYTKPHPMRWMFWLLAFIALQVGLATVTITEGALLNIDFNLGVITNLIGLLVNILLLYVALRVVAVVRWCIFWVAAGSLLMLILTGSPKIDFGIEGLTTGAKGGFVGFVVGLLCFLHVSAWLLSHKLYPHALRHEWFVLRDLQWYFRVQPLERQPGRFTYRIPPPFPFWLPCLGRDHTFGYEGELDADGQPHGLGTWTDDARHGESLQGVWSHGIPIGPFRASEFHTDYRFSSVRVAFVHNRADGIHGRWWRPAFCSQGLHWGVASVETSIAGAWFKTLPSVRVLEETVRLPSVSGGARWCLERLLSLQPLSTADTQQLLVTARGGTLHVSGHELPTGADAASVTIQLSGSPEPAPPNAAGCSASGSNLSAAALCVPHEAGAGVRAGSGSSGAGVCGGSSSGVVGGSGGARRPSGEGGGGGARRLSNDGEGDIDCASVSDVMSDAGSDIGGSGLLRHVSFAGERGRARLDSVPLLRNQSRVPGNHPVLSVTNRTRTESAAPEALIFLPGFNASVETELLVLGQLHTLADVPPHIKLFLFSWPGGRELTYHAAIKHACDERTQADFATLVSSIIEAGVREIHILSHSCGAHVLLSALSKIEPMLQTCEQQERLQWPGQPNVRAAAGLNGQSAPAPAAAPPPTARLATVMLVSPDYPITRFVDSAFPQLRKLCSQITLYSDQTDGALKVSEIFNRDAAGKRVLVIGRHPFKIVRGPVPLSPEALARQAGPSAAEQSSTEGHSGRQEAHSGFLSWVTTSVGEAMAPIARSVSQSVRRRSAERPVQESDLESRVVQHGEPLDLDVIDTSWMDSNVQSMRHTFFNLNRWMLDDIREQLLSKRRAHTRTGRMTHRRGNVWSFIGAPKYIVN